MDGSASKQPMLFEIGNEDRISKLPDSIVCLILSFLPTICCVRTCCLSRRWRFMWTEVPALDFDDEYYGSQFKPYKKKLFANFVNKVLILRKNPCLRRFNLVLTNICTAYHDADTWIRAAIMRDTEELSLGITEIIKLPQTLFTSQSIVRLKLGSRLCFSIPEFVSLPNLKSLALIEIIDLSDASIHKILFGSPVLEDLMIVRGYRDSIRSLSVLSSSLKKFTLKDYCKLQTQFYNVIIDAPQLKYLELDESISNNNYVDIKNISSIGTATFDYNHCCENLPERCGELMVQILNKSNVKVLSMSFFTLLKALVDTANNKRLTCHNMIELTMKYCRADLKILPDMLESFPKLQVLTLAYQNCNHAIPVESLEEKNFEIDCLNYSLKRIVLRSFKGAAAELQLVEYFLKNGKVLMEVIIHSEQQLKAEVWKKLLKFPRWSDACEIVVP